MVSGVGVTADAQVLKPGSASQCHREASASGHLLPSSVSAMKFPHHLYLGPYSKQQN